MLKLWDLDDTLKNDIMKKMMELEFLKWNPYYLRVYREISLQIASSFGMLKWKIEVLEKAEKLKTETGTPFTAGL